MLFSLHANTFLMSGESISLFYYDLHEIHLWKPGHVIFIVDTCKLFLVSRELLLSHIWRWYLSCPPVALRTTELFFHSMRSLPFSLSLSFLFTVILQSFLRFIPRAGAVKKETKKKEARTRDGQTKKIEMKTRTMIPARFLPHHIFGGLMLRTHLFNLHWVTQLNFEGEMKG